MLPDAVSGASKERQEPCQAARRELGRGHGLSLQPPLRPPFVSALAARKFAEIKTFIYSGYEGPIAPEREIYDRDLDKEVSLKSYTVWNALEGRCQNKKPLVMSRRSFAHRKKIDAHQKKERLEKESKECHNETVRPLTSKFAFEIWALKSYSLPSTKKGMAFHIFGF